MSSTGLSTLHVFSNPIKWYYNKPHDTGEWRFQEVNNLTKITHLANGSVWDYQTICHSLSICIETQGQVGRGREELKLTFQCINYNSTVSDHFHTLNFTHSLNFKGVKMTDTLK